MKPTDTKEGEKIRAVELPVTIAGCRRLADKCLSITLHTTREGTTAIVSQMDKWMCGGATFRALLQEDTETEVIPETLPPEKPKPPKGGSSPSQRLRMAIWEVYKRDPDNGAFEPYYEAMIEKLIKKLI